MVLTLSIFLFVIVMALMYFLGMRFWISPKSMVERLMAGEAEKDSVRHPSLAIHDILAKLGQFVPASPTDLTAAQKKLYNAGFRSPTAFKVFYGMKVLAALLFPTLAWLLGGQFGVSTDNRIMLLVAAAGLGFLAPNEFVNFQIKRRKHRINRGLPNALDLLIVCVESGLGLDQAIVQVSREMQQSYKELSSEFAITNLEMRHGKARGEALRNLGDRTGLPDMKKLVSTLIQADRFGTSIAQTLRTHADFMRMTARQRAEEKAAKLAIKLIFPIFFCILPSLFVVTVGPVVYRIMNVLIPMMEGT
jgi:tight adherence protein C